MLLNRLIFCNVLLLAVFHMVSTMAESICKRPPPRQLLTSFSRCITFRRTKGTNRVNLDTCKEDDQNQLLYFTKISKTETVLHNSDNNMLLCYDSCREKFVTIDRDEVEENENGLKLRKRLNRLRKKEEHLFRRARNKPHLRKLALQKRLNKILHKIKQTEAKLHLKPRTMCPSEARELKHRSGRHTHIRHCGSKEKLTDHLYCTLHEVMDDEGHVNMYALLPRGIRVYMIGNRKGKLRKRQIDKYDTIPHGQFIMNKV